MIIKESETKEKVVNYIKKQLFKDAIVLLFGFWVIVKFIFEADWAWKILVLDGILFFIFALPVYSADAAKEGTGIWRYILTTLAFFSIVGGLIALFFDTSHAFVLIMAGIVMYFICWVTSPIKIKIKR